MSATLINLRDCLDRHAKPWVFVIPEGIVYIDRRSKWGNKFITGKHGTREEVVAKHLDWITTGEGQYLLADLPELKGKILACWCAPQPCHGLNYLRLLKERGIE